MRSTHSTLAAVLLPLAFGAFLSGCSSVEVRNEVAAKSRTLQKGPETAPTRSITNFSSALRCMDGLMLEYGTRDISVITEDIVDETKKVNAGTKDMLISAVSDMTRRSHAIRLIAYGKDSGNTIGYLYQAEQRNLYAVIPQYSIKGSISQFDDNLVKKNVDGGFSVTPWVSAGAAVTASSSVVGIDLSVLSTQDLSVVPGVSSRNQVLILRDGQGFDGEATIKKFGINFSQNVSQSEGQAQALRTLVELASIELVGKLTHVPYWKCLGANPDDEAVRNEIADWYDSMRADPGRMLGWWALQMRLRGAYDGPLEGPLTPALKNAVADYRAALGMSREPKLSLDFYSAYLRADHEQAKKRLAALTPREPAQPQAPGAPGAPSAPGTPGTGPIALTIAPASGRTRFAAGEPVDLVVTTSTDAHVYCYLRDEDGKVARFYPNRFARDSMVRAGVPLALPGKMRFQLVANDKGIPETVACYATPRDLLAQLPPAVVGSDFDALPVRSLAEVGQAFAATSPQPPARGEFQIDVRR